MVLCGLSSWRRMVGEEDAGEDPESGLGLLTSGIDLRDLVGWGRGWVEGIHPRRLEIRQEVDEPKPSSP